MRFYFFILFLERWIVRTIDPLCVSEAKVARLNGKKREAARANDEWIECVKARRVCWDYFPHTALINDKCLL